MLMDKLSTFADNLAVTATTQGEAIDLVKTGRDLGAGEPLYVETFVNEAAAAAGAATVRVKVITGDTLDGNGDIVSPTTVVNGNSQTLASMVAGARLDPLMIPAGQALKRYVGIQYDVTTGPLTAGKFTSTLVPRMLGNIQPPAEQ